MIQISCCPSDWMNSFILSYSSQMLYSTSSSQLLNLINFSVHLLYLSTLWFMFGTSLHIMPLLIFSFFSCIFFPSDLCEQFYNCHFELFSMWITYPHFIKFCFCGFILLFHLEHIPISSFFLTFCVDFCTLDKTTISLSLEWSGLV